MRLLGHRGAWLLVASTVVYGICALTWPRAILWATSREGPIEQTSHVVLAVVVAAWFVLAGTSVARGRARDAWVAVPIALYLAFLLLEEIDWGLVYGVDIGFERAFGAPAIHTLVRNPVHLWNDVQFWAVLPAIAWFSTPLMTWGRAPDARAARPVPTLDDSIVFAATLVVEFSWSGLGVALGLGRDAPLFEVMGLYQLVVYVLFGQVALRTLRTPPRVDPGTVSK